MFPLFEQAHKQMRHQQFIARTITQRPFPTVGPGLAEGPAPASELLGRSQFRVQTTTASTHTFTDHRCSVTLTLWSLYTQVPPLCCFPGSSVSVLLPSLVASPVLLLTTV